MLDIVISLSLVAYMISNLLVQWQLHKSIDILADRVTALEHKENKDVSNNNQ